MKTQQGKEFHSHVQKKDGEESVLKDKFVRDGVWALASFSPEDNCNVSAGVTISRGNFQFARLDVGITFSFDPCKIDEGSAFEIAQFNVEEMLSREEAEIRGSARPDSPMKPFGPEQGIVGRSIYLGYGLTLNGAAKFESHRIDIGRTKRIGDSEDIAAAYLALGEELGARISEERGKIEGRSGDKGI